MFGAMARYDVRDPYCVPDEGRDWLDGIEDGVVGLRIGVLRRPGFDAAVDTDGIAAVERAAVLLAEAGAIVEEAAAQLPDTREVFSRVWGATLSRLVANTPQQQREWLDPGILEVARTLGGMSAIEYLDAEAMRSLAAHEMARLHQTFDLVLCPTVPGPPPLADAALVDPVEALWTQWAPWTFTFNITRQPAISMPLGMRANGLPNSVQLAAAQYGDGLVLRAARAIEQAVPVQVWSGD
jgi:aspartyl-tRNA(Asn)/glutamyl-tRNA(Gln) amidotransferase subunit A